MRGQGPCLTEADEVIMSIVAPDRASAVPRLLVQRRPRGAPAVFRRPQDGAPGSSWRGQLVPGGVRTVCVVHTACSVKRAGRCRRSLTVSWCGS